MTGNSGRGPTGGAATGKGPGGTTKASRQAAARQQALAARQARRARERRRRLLLRVGLPVLAVILVVAGFVVVKATTSRPAATAATGTAGAALEKSLAAIPAATFDAVGPGEKVVAAAKVTGAALTANGKPRVLYIGAEYCPYCAGERWAVVAALSRFGSFSNLGTTSSAAGDIYPNTATLSFHGATYTSSLLSFTGVEEKTNVVNAAGDDYTALDTVSAADQKIDSTYNPKGSIPFVDFGNQYVVVGASYDVSVLQGLSQAQIAAQLADPTTAVAKGAIGAANMMTAALCKMTAGRPAAVCSSRAVTTATLP